MIKTSIFIATPDMPGVSYVNPLKGEIEENVSKAAEYGFDAVELIIGDPDTFDVKRMKDALEKSNMEIACINTGRMVSQYGLTLIHPDEQKRRNAFAKLQSLVKVASQLNCALNIGLFRGSALETKPINYTKELFVEIMKNACDFAGEYNVNINFEPTERFEINFINSTNDGLEIIRRVSKPNFGLLLDLYHIYIEDDSFEESILKAQDCVKHFHFSDSDRWPAGVGHGVVDFKALIELLKKIGFNGYLSEGLVMTDNLDECATKTASYLKELINQ